MLGSMQVWSITLACPSLNARKQTSSSPLCNSLKVFGFPHILGALYSIQREEYPGIWGRESKASVAPHKAHHLLQKGSDWISPFTNFCFNFLKFLSFAFVINKSDVALLALLPKLIKIPICRFSSLDILYQINSTNEPWKTFFMDIRHHSRAHLGPWPCRFWGQKMDSWWFRWASKAIFRSTFVLNRIFSG